MSYTQLLRDPEIRAWLEDVRVFLKDCLSMTDAELLNNIDDRDRLGIPKFSDRRRNR